MWTQWVMGNRKNIMLVSLGFGLGLSGSSGARGGSPWWVSNSLTAIGLSKPFGVRQDLSNGIEPQLALSRSKRSRADQIVPTQPSGSPTRAQSGNNSGFLQALWRQPRPIIELEVLFHAAKTLVDNSAPIGSGGISDRFGRCN